MKKLLFIILTIGLLTCDNTQDNNQYIPYKPVDFTINLLLSEGIELQTAGNYKTFINRGHKGVVVYYLGGEQFFAFDLVCPHYEISTCNAMQIEYPFMVCPCDQERFQLTNGAPENGNITEVAVAYSVSKNGNILRVFN